jgi:ribokinase
MRTAELSKKNGAIFMLNPAPAIHLPQSLFPMIDYLTPNKSELEYFSGMEVTGHDSAKHAAEKLLKKGVKNIIVTLGSEGALLVNREKTEIYPGAKVKAIDTTAAGDAFNGALAYSLERGDNIEQAIKFANYVASLSVTKLGAQSSMPTLDEIKKHNIAS